MIRWITVTLGTAPYRAISAGLEVDRLDVRDLLDREGNSPALMREAVERGRRLLEAGRKVVVCCEHGMSRSNAIAAGILATHEGVSLNTAIRKVLFATGEDSIRLEVLATLRAALQQPDGQPARRNSQPRVLVTGATGMIGAQLCAEPLPAGIAALVPVLSGSLDLRRDAVPLDLLVREQEVDVIVHLAHPRISTTNRSLGEAVTMLKNVLDVCRENSVRLVYASSCEIYSGHEGTIVVDEGLIPRPATTLGIAKLLAEQLIETYRRQYGLRAAVLRLTTVYGGSASRPAFLWNFIEKAVRHAPIQTHRCPAGFPTVDLLHVNDVCRALFAAVETGSDTDFNLGGGQNTGTDELARHVVELASSASRISRLAVERRLCNLTADFRRASEVLGWRPEISIRDGIRQLLSGKPQNDIVAREPRVPI